MSEAPFELLNRLLEEHGAALVLYASGWSADPEDVVQEAILKLIKLPAPPENPVAWLYRVVRNGAIDAARAQSARARNESEARRGRPQFIANGVDQLDARAVAEAVQGLPPLDRETVTLRIWGKLSFEEIAHLTETSKSTAHRRYLAALEAVREKLGTACPRGDETP